MAGRKYKKAGEDGIIIPRIRTAKTIHLFHLNVYSSIFLLRSFLILFKGGPFFDDFARWWRQIGYLARGALKMIRNHA